LSTFSLSSIMINYCLARTLVLNCFFTLVLIEPRQQAYNALNYALKIILLVVLHGCDELTHSTFLNPGWTVKRSNEGHQILFARKNIFFSLF
jgi:hypothetical protein